jgi:ferredoxin-NADP reductase
MENHIVKILETYQITHDVIRFRLEKPFGYKFKPGQATEISINQTGYQTETRPFTFTSLNEWNFLEFTIKIYNDHPGVTNKLASLKSGDELIIHDVWGEIAYKGQGIFIAGGAGITPFIAILRELASKNKIGENKLIFANKTKSDIILEEEFKKILGSNFINILADERVCGYLYGLISRDILKAHLTGLNQMIYLCGPPPMMSAVEKQLTELGVDLRFVVKEAF